ncbi:MAG: hypothetical protein U0X74_08655 [Anaerolineales bacterium]
MFEYLDKETIQNGFPAVHQVIQISRKQWDYALRHSNEGIKSGLNSSQAELVSRIIQEIEVAENKKIEDLPSETVDKYINILVERIEKLSRQQLNVNQSVGKNLLNKLRVNDISNQKE